MPAPCRLPGCPAEAADGEDVFARAAREGSSAKELARELLELAGFAEIEAAAEGLRRRDDLRRARRRRAATWCSTCCGAFTSARPGLKRTETVWRRRSGAPRRAATALRREHDDGGRDVVLLSTDLPAQGQLPRHERSRRRCRHRAVTVTRGGHARPDGLSTCSNSSRRDSAPDTRVEDRGWSSGSSSSSSSRAIVTVPAMSGDDLYGDILEDRSAGGVRGRPASGRHLLVSSLPSCRDVPLLHRPTGLRGTLWKFTGELVVLKDSKGRQHTFEHQPGASRIRARP